MFTVWLTPTMEVDEAVQIFKLQGFFLCGQFIDK